MIKRAIAVLMLIVVATAFQIGNASASSTDGPSSPYSSHRLNKPAWYADLSSWTTGTYSTDPEFSRYLLPETLKETRIDYGKDKGKPAVSFVTFELDRYFINTLVDSGAYLNLYTIEAQEEMESFSILMDSEKMRAALASCDTCNCVTWVRCARASWLPYGLTTLADKKRAINSSSADAGKVAVHDIYYPYGHVSYIYKTSGSTIYIEEANYSRCQVTKRSGSKSSLKIIGYIKR